ncbi:ABC transporter permease [Marinobacter xestospongiae]|uniref:ABC transporter permease n=1 Tax=Marinobacter xestospongiae TaxID=994319 RepID=A0ABU3W0Q5_9GAMM|nr:ABC transporter permease [Marinobacter xestospongiae]MDV2080119.1 ABC transporter permease [Marinobacter xestospongiae]
MLAPNRVILVLGAIALLLFCSLNFGTIQPNRIVEGTPYGALDALGWGGFALVTLLLAVTLVAAVLTLPGRYWAILVCVVLLLMALPWLFSGFLESQLGARYPYGRGGFAAGFWSLLFLLALMLVEGLRQVGAGVWLRLTAGVLVLLSWWRALDVEALAGLSLVMEFQTRPDQFQQALLDHLALTLGAVMVSLLLAVPLVLVMIRRARWQRPVFALVSFLQTIPSLALFGLLIAPLSYLSANLPLLQQLGIRGIGWAPAMIALVAYSLLPMVRNLFVALTEVPANLLEAAEGMGMNRRQVFLRVRLPLALPVVIEGLRMTTIQATGLTAVAALVGAGGFGTFIFQGLGQAAMDLVLLGALPTVALALAADALFTALARLSARLNGATAQPSLIYE